MAAVGSMSITGLDIKDARWAGLHGGYRIPYDPREGASGTRTGSKHGCCLE
jgi:hypothetical protein